MYHAEQMQPNSKGYNKQTNKQANKQTNNQTNIGQQKPNNIFPGLTSQLETKNQREKDSNFLSS